MAYEQMAINYEVAQRLRAHREHFGELFTSSPTGLTLGATIGMFMDVFEHVQAGKSMLGPELLQRFAASYPRKGRSRRASGATGAPVRLGVPVRKKDPMAGHEFRKLVGKGGDIGRCIKCSSGMDFSPKGDIWINDCVHGDQPGTFRGPGMVDFIKTCTMDFEWGPTDAEFSGASGVASTDDTGNVSP